MCDPATMALTTLTTTALSSFGAIATGQAQAATFEARAAIAERQSEAERISGQYQARRAQERAGAMAGAQRAGLAGRGLDASGSGLDIIADSAREAALDVAAVQFGSTIKSQNYRMQAGIDRAAGRQAEMAGYIRGAAPWLRLAGNEQFGNNMTKLGLNPFAG